MTDKQRLARVERALGEIVYSMHAAGVGSERVLARTEPMDDNSFVGRREKTRREGLEYRTEAA
jgi:hypothetical protein